VYNAHLILRDYGTGPSYIYGGSSDYGGGIGEAGFDPFLISLSVDVPGELRKEGRTYYLLQSHDGKAVQMAKGKGPALTWEGDRFSRCLLAYAEAGGSSGPISEMQDGSGTLLLLAVLTVLAAVGVVSIVMRKR
jgi:hypothetical protein